MRGGAQRLLRLASSARPNSATAPRTKPSANGQNPAAARLLDDGGGRDKRRSHQRVFALDHAAGDVIGDGIDDDGDIVGLGEHDAAEAGVLHEAIDSLVAPHHDVGHHVDPQPRSLALADAAIEQIDGIGNLREQRIERLVQNFEPGDFGIAQVDDDAGAIGGLDPRAAAARRAAASDARRRPLRFRYFVRLTSA